MPTFVDALGRDAGGLIVVLAIGGVRFAGALNASIPTAGTGYERNAIVATLDNRGNLPAVNAFSLQILIGALILMAVGFDPWQSWAR